MSTCRGALPPHLDCRHGDACDWRAEEATRAMADLDPLAQHPALVQEPEPSPYQEAA